MTLPKILAPAGNRDCFLAAVAAGADAVYCGLKIFSARMEAENFSIEELSALTRLAHSKNVEVFLALNSIIKEKEKEKVFRILCKLRRFVDCDALIIQDPAIIVLAQKAGFKNKFHLSTLGNCTFPSGLAAAADMGFKTIVLPREFTIDEIKNMAEKIPENTDLEIFVHGALCYSVSGRCYWSSWFGGKSALRGRCVQPCRRMYEQKGKKQQYFSCMDFSADVLCKVLRQIPEIGAWKIEGRKKGPHYVYYTVKAYKILRDHPEDKKQALLFLDYAMGRQFTHYNLLSQRKMNPLDHLSETGSGLFAGRVKNPGEPYFITRESLFPSDLLRIGFEDDTFHDIQKVTRAVPKKAKFYLNRKLKHKIKKGTPVFIIDRRGKELADKLDILAAELENITRPGVGPVKKSLDLPPGRKHRKILLSETQIHVSRGNQRQATQKNASWISTGNYGNAPSSGGWLWLDPLIFPDEEKKCAQYISRAIRKGAKKFVLNAPWQLSFFKNPEKLNLWAGPFCNIANSAAIYRLKKSGFSGVIISPELDRETILSLPASSTLPLGIVIHGLWPLGISRSISSDLALNKPFTSPKGEISWVSKHNNNYYVFPNWYLDLRSKKDLLKKAGFCVFVHINEHIPRGIRLKKRPGLWNWNLTLL